MLPFCALLLVGCVSPKPRIISGHLVQPASRRPIPAQQLDLDRPAGNYPGISMLVLGVPQPTVIARVPTDERGYFEFTTTMDRGRFLTIRLAGTSRSNFRSPTGYTIERLHDSLDPTANTAFDPHILHKAGGGFRSLP